MLDTSQKIQIASQVKDMLNQARIVVTEEEMGQLEIAEYGMDLWSSIGLQIIVYVNTENCCAKEMILFQRQTCPEHRHPPMQGSAEKKKLFAVDRVRSICMLRVK